MIYINEKTDVINLTNCIIEAMRFFDDCGKISFDLWCPTTDKRFVLECSFCLHYVMQIKNLEPFSWLEVPISRFFYRCSGPFYEVQIDFGKEIVGHVSFDCQEFKIISL